MTLQNNTEYNKEETLKWVDMYRTMGLCVIPQEFRGKKAIVKWKEYQDTPPSYDIIKKWFSTPANIGILCGSPSKNLVVLDFESETAYKSFFSKRDIRKETFSVKTNRGCHVYLRTTRPMKTTPIPGVLDVISQGHLATAPPSIHKKGTEYTPMSDNRVILEVPNEDFKNIFWKKAERLGYYKDPGIRTEYGNISNLPEELPPCIKKLMLGISEGQRNNVGFAISTYLKNQGKSEEEITKELVGWNKKNIPPMGYEEIISIVKSVLSSEYGIGCNNPYLQSNCTSKIGECVFQDVVPIVIENTTEVRRVYPKVDTDTIKFRIFVMNESFEMTSDKMLTPAVFKQRWLEKHKKLLNLSQKGWRRIVNYWMDIAETWGEDVISTEQDVVDRIISEIELCDITTDKENVIHEQRFLYVEKFPSKEGEEIPLYYPNRNIKEIINTTGVKIDLRRLRELLDDYIYENTKKIRSGRMTERFWVFKSSKFDIDWKSQTINNEEKDAEVVKFSDPKLEVKNENL